jgi:hypothetical protein
MEKYCFQWTDVTACGESKLRTVRDAVAAAVSHSFGGDEPVIEPCGSFLLRTTTFTSPNAVADKPRAVVMDIVVVMPLAVCSLEHLEHGQYLTQRRVFIEQLLDGLGRSFAPASLRLEPFQNDTSKNVIAITLPREEGDPAGLQFVVHVHARPQSAPGRISSAKALKKAPVYGNAVLEDFLMHSHLEKLHRLCLSSPTIVKAIITLRCWAAHRGILGSKVPEGLTGFHVAAIVLSLVEEGILTTAMSEENVVRSVWVQLARGHFSTPTPTLILNGEQHNILHRVSSEYYNMFVRSAAEEALQVQSAADVFSTAGHSPLHLRVGVVLQIRGVGEWMASRSVSKDQHLFWAPDCSKIFHEAFGLRARAIFCTVDVAAERLDVYVALKDNAEARQRLTRGPAIEDQAAVKAFDDFWGSDKTSTRQFADGAVHRCVVWDVPEAPLPTAVLDPALVARTIAEAVAHRHIHRHAEVTVLLQELSSVLKEQVGAEWLDPVVLVDSHLRQAANRVSELIKNVHAGALPCRISSFDFISTSLRGTEPFGIRPHFSLLPRDSSVPGVTCAPSIEPLHAVLTIDDKHKIPDTVEAISKMKGAICAQLGSVLRKEVSSPTFTIFTTPTSVDIVTGGFLFRIYIAHFREVSLLRALQRPAEANLLERKLFWASQHAKFIQSICDGHQDYPEAVRLSRRWVAAMLLSDFILAETVELVVAQSYMQPTNAPSSPVEGFFRFLQTMSTHPWSKRPLIIPTTENAGPLSDAAEHDGMWIAAPYAPTVSPFTQHTPRSMIVDRLVALSTKALVALDSGASVSVFTHGSSCYDMLFTVAGAIKLHPDRDLRASSRSANSDVTHRVSELPQNLQTAFLARLVEFDPVAHLIRKLRSATRESCMLFYDAFGPSIVACVLLAGKPAAADVARAKATILAEAMGGVGEIVPPQVRKKRRMEPK